ncbi:cold shock domain-containing protein [Pseudoxanthomonas sangjuensis]|uniref:cold shock domain-containing protein n=1 Tax=Pseudoxanthomonas sangjuensis TaxID=1503750 RepID=UPI001391291D|nr:cold shock domain-containing protein [Pseudoxanthomonas sangjuensis]KAF1715709.1 cold-shock protein [Pseudoxanthomonas sangjuensis]
MSTRTHGTLSRWNDDRGFGFITPAADSDEIFVHVSAFPRDGVRPRVGELVSYEVEEGNNGKPRAVRVMRPGGQRAARTPQRRNLPETGSGFAGRIVALLAIGTIGAVGYKAYTARQAATRFAAPEPSASAAPPAAGNKFQCDGREYCSQMTSYEEAVFFIRHCPNTKMDGDSDGNPCESQFGR